MNNIDIRKLRSSVIKQSVIEDIGKVINDSIQVLGKVSSVIYLHDSVIAEEDYTSVQTVKPEFLKEMRIFNDKGELYIWKLGGKLRYRLRTDESGEDNEYFDQACFSIKRDDLDLPVKYVSRNYLSYDDDGIMVFTDARLVRFED